MPVYSYRYAVVDQRQLIAVYDDSAVAYEHVDRVNTQLPRVNGRGKLRPRARVEHLTTQLCDVCGTPLLLDRQCGSDCPLGMGLEFVRRFKPRSDFL